MKLLKLVIPLVISLNVNAQDCYKHSDGTIYFTKETILCQNNNKQVYALDKTNHKHTGCWDYQKNGDRIVFWDEYPNTFATYKRTFIENCK